MEIASIPGKEDFLSPSGATRDLSKLGVRDRTRAVLKALELKLI